MDIQNLINGVDSFFEELVKRKSNEKYIASLKQILTRFLVFLSKKGVLTTDAVTESDVMAYFFDNDHDIGICTAKKLSYALFLCFKNSGDYSFSRIASLIPSFPKRNTLYNYLNDDDIGKIQDFLLSDNHDNVSLRDKSIVTIAFFLGLRGCDIASLTFDNIDFDNSTISLIQQKTKQPLCLPMPDIVANSIYKYLSMERPESDKSYVFLTTAKFGIHKLGRVSITYAMTKVVKACGIDTTNKRSGIHQFRRKVAYDLIEQNISQPIITKILGHTSPNSLSSYLSTDQMKLKECALSIEEFPCKITL